MNRGFGLLEIIAGIAVISVSIFGLAAVMNISLKISEEALKNTKASFLLSEGWEAVKTMRDVSFQNKISPLAVESDNFLDFDGAVWKATSSNIYIDGVFERKFVLENVLRDVNDDIVSSGGALDTNTKKITVSVSWKGRTDTTTKQIEGYITNLFNN